jgi:hypothetical protein
MLCILCFPVGVRKFVIVLLSGLHLALHICTATVLSITINNIILSAERLMSQGNIMLYTTQIMKTVNCECHNCEMYVHNNTTEQPTKRKQTQRNKLINQNPGFSGEAHKSVTDHGQNACWNNVLLLSLQPTRKAKSAAKPALHCTPASHMMPAYGPPTCVKTLLQPESEQEQPPLLSLSLLKDRDSSSSSKSETSYTSSHFGSGKLVYALCFWLVSVWSLFTQSSDT